jgi:hypothetical protein
MVMMGFSFASTIARIAFITRFCISGFDRWIAFSSIAFPYSPVATDETAPPPIPIR